jgi:Spy/CpxP family protein refolding chaperone
MFVLVALLFVVYSVYAVESGGRSRHEGGGQDAQPALREKINTDNLRQILTFKNELELSVEQVESIMKLREQNIKDIHSCYEALSSKQLELSGLLAAPNPDFVGARRMSPKISEAAVNVQSVSIDAYEKAYNLLTENQKMKFAIIREKMQKERDLENHSK